MNRTIFKQIYGFFLLSRLPFHIVGILPFILGTVLASYDGYSVQFPVLILGIAGTVCIMLSAYYAGEYYDQEEDNLSHQVQKSSFAGGSQAIQLGLVHPEQARVAAILALTAAGVIGLLLWLLLHTGPLTIPLGILGMVGGYLYSARPVRWVSRGLGELWIALCYGWLSLTAAYYLQAGNIPSSVFILSIPIASSIAAVIIMNEFPDYETDKKAGKKNILVRIGMKRGSLLYCFLCLTAIGTAGIISQYYSAFYLMTPCISGGIILTLLMIKKMYREITIREWMCGGTILLNCGIIITFITIFIR